MKNLVTATFKTREDSLDALSRLESIGITDEQISLIVTDKTRGNTFNMESHSRVDEGTAAGATAGGLIGLMLGAMATAGTIVIPGLNLVVTGALAGSLAGLGAGAATGGLAGGLVGAGMTEHEAKLYVDEIKDGGILLAVRAADDDQKDLIRDTLEEVECYHLAA
jgi:uncharacterized membrane protein